MTLIEENNLRAETPGNGADDLGNCLQQLDFLRDLIDCRELEFCPSEFAAIATVLELVARRVDMLAERNPDNPPVRQRT